SRRTQGVAIEYRIPLTAKCVDFILTGCDADGNENAVIVELKQWSEVEATGKDAGVATVINGARREVPHPSYQAWTYAALIRDFNETVQEESIRLRPCAFEFYARVLGGEIKAAVPYGEGTPDMPVAPEQKNWLMHCWLEIGDQAIMGADMGKEGAPSIDKPKNGFDVTLISTIRTRRRPWVDVPRRKAASEQVIQSRQSRAGKSV